MILTFSEQNKQDIYQDNNQIPVISIKINSQSSNELSEIFKISKTFSKIDYLNDENLFSFCPKYQNQILVCTKIFAPFWSNFKMDQNE